MVLEVAHGGALTTLRQRLSLSPIARLELLLFLCLWLSYGAAINSDNLVKFNLQQIGVEALVERHHFYLEGSSVAELRPYGDVFVYRDHQFAAKQPGQSMAGAVVYAVLRAFGLRYANNYLLTSALVTFFTASLILAASAIVVFRIARRLTSDRRSIFWPVLTTFAYALATTIFAYSGIAHHDSLATGYVVLAFYLVFDLPRADPNGWSGVSRTAGAGFLLGLTITTSMLASLLALVCALYFFWLRPWKLIPLFVAALTLGLLPLLVYDAYSFGSPFLLPNVAGGHLFADTFFRFSAKNVAAKLVRYSTMLIVYAPVFLVGLFGLSLYPRVSRRTPFFRALLGMLILLAVYVLNIKTTGDCQFGPRYLLSAMPFACLGIVGYSYLSTVPARRLAASLVLSVGLLSFGVNLVGAVRGAMNCPEGQDALSNQLARLGLGETNDFPLAPWLVVPLVICFARLVWSLVRERTADLLPA